MLSQKLQKIAPSATFLMKQKATEFMRQGKSVISLTIGEPDFDVPDHIKQAAKQAIDDGQNKYTASAGLYELKEAICTKFKRDNDLDYDLSQVMATAGGKQALYNIFQAILNPCEEVILPEPFWVSYVEQIRLADGEPVFVNTIDDNFKLTAAKVEQAITAKTKALVLCSPSNPTGTTIDREEIAKIAALAVKHNFYVISDEVYEFLYFTEEKPISIGSLNPEIFHLTLTVNAISKAFSMTGWRLGFVGGPAEIIKLMDNLQGHSTSNPNIIAQFAAMAALTGSLEPTYAMREAFDERRAFVAKEIASIEGLSVAPMEGAFYAFMDVSKFFVLKNVSGSDEFCLKLLEELGLALTPGSAFGPSCDPYVRMSYAASMDELEEGMRRLKIFLTDDSQH